MGGCRRRWWSSGSSEVWLHLCRLRYCNISRNMAVETPKSPRMSAEERREQLLDATKRVVEAHGFHRVSIEAVAKEAGITRPIVYGHFHDLAGLLEALVERETARALSQLVILQPEDLAAGDPRGALLASLRSYLGAVRADP